MKNTVRFFSALAVLLCGVVLAGCDLANDVAKEADIYDKWYEYDFTYSDKVTFECYMYYATKNTSEGKCNGGDGIELEKGLNIVMIPQSDDSSAITALFENFTSNQYLLYKCGSSDVEVDEDESGSNSKRITVNESTWLLSLTQLKKKDAFVGEEEPWLLNNKKATEFSLSGIKTNFTWKSLLRTILLAAL